MGKRTIKEFKTVELVLHVGETQCVGALFAVRTSDRGIGRRLLARAIRPKESDVSDLHAIVETLRSALDEIEQHRFTPPR